MVRFQAMGGWSGENSWKFFFLFLSDSPLVVACFRPVGSPNVTPAASVLLITPIDLVYPKRYIFLHPFFAFFQCEHIPGRQFRSGSYKCMCRQGFEYPFNDLTWFFDGETMEKEYELMIHGQPSRYDLLKCRQGHAMTLQISMGLVFVTAYIVALH